jgi:hypothetical protein
MTTTRVPGLGGIWQSEHDFRDKHASQFTTGRFVLLPKDLVTGVAKARIVSRATCSGRVPLETMKPRLSRGFFLADAHDASHFEAGALVPSWALPPWRSGRGSSRAAGITQLACVAAHLPFVGFGAYRIGAVHRRCIGCIVALSQSKPAVQVPCGGGRLAVGACPRGPTRGGLQD